MKYLADCDLIVYDLHSGNPQDVRLALEALRKHKFEEEKTLILISSLMAWKGTPEKLEEIKTKEQLEEEARAAAAREVPAGGEGDAGAEGQEEQPKASEDGGDEEAKEGDDDEKELSFEEFQEEPPKKKERKNGIEIEKKMSQRNNIYLGLMYFLLIHLISPAFVIHFAWMQRQQ